MNENRLESKHISITDWNRRIYISELLKRKIGINYPGYKNRFCSYDTWLYLREKDLVKFPYLSPENPDFIDKILKIIDSELERLKL